MIERSGDAAAPHEPLLGQLVRGLANRARDRLLEAPPKHAVRVAGAGQADGLVGQSRDELPRRGLLYI